MTGIEIQILPLLNIRQAEPSALQIWSSLQVNISDPVGLGYPENPYSSHHGSELRVLLNWLFCLLINVWVHLVGGFSVGVEPVWLIYWGVGATPSLQRDVDHTFLPFLWLLHTHLYTRPHYPTWYCQCKAGR